MLYLRIPGVEFGEEFAFSSLIVSTFFLIGFLLAVNKYKKKRTSNNLILIFLMCIGASSVFFGILSYITSIWVISPLFGFISIVILISTLINLNNRLERKLQRIRTDLVRRTSHELKTPLISIFSSTEHLINTYGNEMSEDVLKFIRIINRGGKRLKLLTENLLDAYNIESSGLKLKKERVNIVKTIKDCVNDLYFLINERGLYLKEDLDGEFNLNLDKIRFEQVILNLLSNAIKNTPPKGIIYVKSEIKDGFVDIVIKDTGIGLTENEKKQLFKQFGKIERRDEGYNLNSEGSGLGLYISKEIIEKHVGKILVESEGRNKGATFIIRLPNN